MARKRQAQPPPVAPITGEPPMPPPVAAQSPPVTPPQHPAAPPRKADETVPGGRYLVAGRWLNAHGQPVEPPPHAED